MATDLETSFKNAAEQIVGYIKNASELTVQTLYVEIGPNSTGDFSQAKPAAQTTLKLDGDNTTVVPLHQSPTGNMEIDNALFELHQRNVAAAIQYRAQILTALLNAFQAIRRPNV